jgi:hypothetical protein
MSELEAKFNRKFDYPYVFLNEEPFTEEFKRSVTALTRSKIEFGLIPHEQWYQPDFIDEEKATAGREQMLAANVIYGGAYSSTAFLVLGHSRLLLSQAASHTATCCASTLGSSTATR